MNSDKRLSSYDDFYANLHRSGASLVEFGKQRVPCICLEDQRFRKFVDSAAATKVVVDTNLDIFHNEKDVFVNVIMKVMDTTLGDSFLFHANDMLPFFKAMLDSGIIVLSSNNASTTPSENIFAIQLPKKDKLEEAFRIIFRYANQQTLR